MSKPPQPPNREQLDRIQAIIVRIFRQSVWNSPEYQRIARFFDSYGMHLEADFASAIILDDPHKVPVDWDRFITDLNDTTEGRDRTAEILDFTRFMLNGTKTTETELDDLVTLLKQLNMR